jgi:hypothetical protein
LPSEKSCSIVFLLFSLSVLLKKYRWRVSNRGKLHYILNNKKALAKAKAVSFSVAVAIKCLFF